MSTQVKRRYGSTEEHASFIGADRELTVDTSKHTVVVHDGSKAGGHPLATEEYVDDKIAEALADLDTNADSSSYRLKLAKIQYIDFGNDYWGLTVEEKAKNIAKFDIHVSGGINQDTIPIIQRAKEINPRLKICYYISVASGRPWYDQGWYTFRRGAIWDEAWAAEQSTLHNNIMTRPSNKWEIFQEIEMANHVGGTKTGKTILIETYHWTDENGVAHSDNKYIDEYAGGYSYDGFFWDDVGFDTNITSGLFYDSDNSSQAIESIKRQGFNSRRDKYICINQFARDRGMFVIPNSIDKDDLFDPAISDSNPDGLGSSITSNDYVFIESCLTMVGNSNSVIWRNEISRVVNYLTNWYEIVGAKVICEDYIYGSMEEATRDYLITFMMATYTAIGVHYFALTDIDLVRPSNDLYVPECLSLPVPVNHTDRKTYLTNPATNVYKYDYAAVSLSVTRNAELSSGDVSEYGVLNGTKILLNGNPIINAFLSDAEVHASLKTEIDQLSSDVDAAISDTKRNASIYNRLMIDDWSVTNLVYTNFVTDAIFTAWGDASATKNSSKGATTTYDVPTRKLQWSLPDLAQYYQTEYMIVKIYPAQYSHLIELGFKLTTQGSGIGAWIDAWIDGNFWFEAGANPSQGTSTLYPDATGMYVATHQLIDYGSREYIELKFLGSWNSNATSAILESLYVIDTQEFSEDVTKSSYTNLLPSPTPCLGYSDPYLFALSKTDADTFDVTMYNSVVYEGETKTYINGNGPAWWTSTNDVLQQGHTYEIGIQNYTVTKGSLSFTFDVNTDSGNLCGNIPISEKIYSRVFPVNTYNKIFTVGEDDVLGNSLLSIRYFLANGETEPGNFTIDGWYLFDINEENVIIRGLSPSNTSIMIARVNDANFQSDITNGTLLKNTLYITETGKMYITDINKNVINLIV